MHDASSLIVSKTNSARALVESLVQHVNAAHPGGVTMASRMANSDSPRRAKRSLRDDPGPELRGISAA